MSTTMPKHPHLSKPIDLSAPGAVDQLLAFHRSVFGTARMEDGAGDSGGDDGAGSAAGDAGAGAGDANGGSGTSGTGDAGNGAQDAQKVEELPEWAQKIIRDARKDAGDSRGAKNAAQKAAEKQQQDMVKAFAKAAGITLPDDKPDADRLTADLTAAQQAQRQTAIELAVHKTASKHSGDPDALLDSRSFLAKVANLDPTASDFASKVDEAIKSALADNPKLKAARAAGSSSADHAGGSGEGANRPKTLGDAVATHYGR